MADTDGVTYRFSADISDLKAKLNEMVQQLQRVATATETTAAKMSSGFKRASDSTKDHSEQLKLNTNQLMILGGAARHTVDALISGQSAMRVLSIEGIKASAAFGGTATASVLAGAAVVAGAALAIDGIMKWGQSYERLQRTAKLTGESILDLNKMQEIANRQLDRFDVAKSLTAMAEKIREAQVIGGDTAKMMERISIPIKDASGKAREFRDILNDVAVAVRDGNNEADKARLVEKLGLDRNSVPWIEDYAKRLADGRLEVSETDKEMVKLQERAAQFDIAWRETWESWTTNAKASIAQVVEDMSKMKNNFMDNAFGPKGTTNDTNYKEGDGGNHQIIANGRIVDNPDNPPPTAETEGTLPNPPPSRPVSRDLSGVYKPEKAKAAPADAGNSFVSSLDKQVAALKAQAEAFGKSAEEQKKSIELAEFDATVQDKWAEMKKRGIAITDQMRDAAAKEREKVAALSVEWVQYTQKTAQLNAVRDSWKEVGDTVANAIDQVTLRGGKLNSVLISLIQSLSSSWLKGLLTGEGALGTAFGFNNPTGGLGGILGGLLKPFMPTGKASGGPVSAGQVYKVGENGEEWFRPDRNGTIISNDQVRSLKQTGSASAGQVGGTTVHFHITTPDAPSFARSEGQITGMLGRVLSRSARTA